MHFAPLNIVSIIITAYLLLLLFTIVACSLFIFVACFCCSHLQLVAQEQFPTSRAADEKNVTAVDVEGVEAMGQLVYELAKVAQDTQDSSV